MKRRRSWAVDRVYVYADCGELVSLPVAWTDMVAADPFVVVADGSAAFRTEDLVELVGLLARLRGDRAGEVSEDVRQIMP